MTVSALAPLAQLDPGLEAVVVLLTEDELRSGSGWLGQPQLDATLQRLREKGVFTGASGQVEALPTHGLLPCAYVLAAGLGPAATRDAQRAAAVFAARRALALRIECLAVALPAGVDEASAAGALTEGLLLGTYRRAAYRRSDAERPDRAELREAALLTRTAVSSRADGAPGTGAAAAPAQPRAGEATAAGAAAAAEAVAAEALAAAIRRARAVAAGTNYARDLTNLPGNKLVPASLAEEAVLLAQRLGFACEVLDERELAARGMGGLLAVGGGSANPPRMIALRYEGDPGSADVLGLVGKGITFDTGGVSLKKAAGMEEMISDMGGAATLLGLLQIVGELRPRINLTVVIPSAENMNSGTAYRPGDVVTLYDGRTVEVLNTDAEGRIVLAEGIAYARELGATRLIDVATLTGAVLVCFADVATGAVTNDDAFLKPLLEAAARAGEKVWQLPNYPEYHDMLKSDVADIRNSTSSDRWAGAITGGLFIGTFADELPWIHLDTGGTAWLWSAKGIEPQGGTGVMVRTLAAYVLDRP
ncbi:leucyl aminopeptidase [Paenibacillus athensensis]|nr:leucyl aminopeptidase [Paenibacillus athensensis]